MGEAGDSTQPIVEVSQVKPEEQEKPQVTEPPRKQLEQPVESAPGEKGKIFRQYLSSRLQSPGLINASLLGKDLPKDRSAEFPLAIEKAYLEIADYLGLDESLLEDPRYCEAFLVLADSWAACSQDNLVEKQFLQQFGRVLAGNKSGFNLDQFGKKIPGADKYVEKDGAAETEKSKVDFERYRQVVEPEKSQALADKMAEKGDGSLLVVVRSELGITGSEETPYRVMVLKAFRTQYGQKEGQIPWEGLAPENTHAFTTTDPEDGVPTIIISEEDFDDLSSEDEFQKKDEISTLGHEYAHTQRQLRIGNETSLGRVWDERMVTNASRGTNHFDTAIVLKTLQRLLPDEAGIRVRDLLQRSVVSNEKMAEFYGFIGDNFGLRSSLMLLAVQPKNYKEPYGIDQISDIRIDPDHRMSDLVSLVISERAQIDPISRDRLLGIYNHMSPEDADNELFLLRYAGIKMPQIIQSAMESRSTQT